MKDKILFILKKREDYNQDLHYTICNTTGLYNSVSFLDKMLSKNGIESKLVIVNDNNDIDREVFLYKPSHVIIEALWVIPEKFEVLTKLHPNVNWIIRLHSNIPFLSAEGMSMGWIGKYAKFDKVKIACNAEKILKEIRFYISHKMKYSKKQVEEKVVYLPNFYPQEYNIKKFDYNKEYIDIGCFGAVRLLKNHLIQAHAAIRFANDVGKKLRFHVNGSRIEMKSEPVLRNLKELFEELHEQGHLLVDDGWLDRNGFLNLCSKMDIGMQVSFSETFNIVAADLLSQGVPVVGSDEIIWMNNFFVSNPCNSDDIIKTLKTSYNFPKINLFLNKKGLTNFTNNSKKIWLKYFSK